MEDELNSVHEVTIKGSGMQVGAVSAFREASELRTSSLGGETFADPCCASVETKLASKPHILTTIIPTFPVACRR